MISNFSTYLHKVLKTEKKLLLKPRKDIIKQLQGGVSWWRIVGHG